MKYNPSHHRAGKSQTIAKRRGLEHIQTMTQLVVDSSNPQHKFMKLAILSMENQRKSKELALAEQLIQDLKARLAQIQIETAGLMSQFQAPSELELETVQGAKSVVLRTIQGQSPGFKLKY
jgi:hypothetical protein